MEQEGVEAIDERIKTVESGIRALSEVQSDLLAGKADLWLLSHKKTDYEESLSYTQPYLDIPQVVVVQREKPIIQKINELEGQIVAVIEQSPAHDFLKRDIVVR